MSPVFTSTAVGLTYPDGTDALHNTSISVADGEFVSILGPSGCGKTTLLRMLAGTEEPDSGSIRMASDTTIGYLPQDGIVKAIGEILARPPAS